MVGWDKAAKLPMAHHLVAINGGPARAALAGPTLLFRQRRAAVEGPPVFDEGEQIGHVLGRNLALEAFGHEGLSAGAQLVDFAPRNDRFFAALLAKRERSGGFCRENAG